MTYGEQQGGQWQQPGGHPGQGPAGDPYGQQGYPSGGYSQPGYQGQPPQTDQYGQQGYPSGGYAQPGYQGQPPPADPYGRQAYAQPGYGPQYGHQPRATNGMAVASLICGLVGLLACGVTSVVGVILGHVSLNQLKRSGEEGRGMAVAGLVTSYIVLAGWLLFAIFFFGVFGFALFGASTSSYYG
ncbi:DUF4190 domain-containing protein [Rhizohabitans arisaemae]|uniref:DUF4190 domain-containing protein n=1 Tax=Rhizohabitans arisaemae TaxID=2720610 RepID=UPI0024B1DA8E|nr:DUF4190 domain-containing protein [Rhizohabitans arisaemae]